MYNENYECLGNLMDALAYCGHDCSPESIGKNEISENLLKELNNLGEKLLVIRYTDVTADAILDGGEAVNYCYEESLDDAIDFLIEYYGVSPEYYCDVCCNSRYAFTLCEYSHNGKEKLFFLPVLLLSSLRVDNYSGENILKNVVPVKMRCIK